jgi:hypothetical protein
VIDRVLVGCYPVIVGQRKKAEMSETVLRPPRPELDAHRQVMTLDDPIVVKELSHLIGPKLVAYLGGVTETRAVAGWIEGSRVPRGDSMARLRLALQVVLVVAGHDSPRVAQSWLQGLNPQLDDRSPARLLREGDLAEAGPQVLAAVRAFVIGG